jgi:hypothetical protein
LDRRLGDQRFAREQLSESPALVAWEAFTALEQSVAGAVEFGTPRVVLAAATHAVRTVPSQSSGGM